MRAMLRALLSRQRSPAPTVLEIAGLRADYTRLTDRELAAIIREPATLPTVIAATAVMASRVLALEMHDEQLAASLALAEGHLVEMQTGEGKTLAAVPAVVWHARRHDGAHVVTANDYLARRDAEWMLPIYERLGLSVGWIGQELQPDARRTAYLADVTYSTMHEVGFDYLRDGLAMDPSELVLRPLRTVTALIDEADSILIDEARIPLVIAGGTATHDRLPGLADRIVRELLPRRHFNVETEGRNVLLTSEGVQHVERALGIANLFDPAHLDAHTAVQNALHAHVLLKKDVDYLIRDQTVVSVDEFKGRTVANRRWPADLQTALEHKEGTVVRAQGRVLGSITVENLVGMYARFSGMTGTASTQSDEFRGIYDKKVMLIPPHRPVARLDHADQLFVTKADKETAIADEVRRVHTTGRPVLVGTASIEESERLSRRLGALPHEVLNARHEAREADIIANAGQRGTVTISTNMAGRGVDIRLGPGVAALGGLHVIGTNRHHSRRIDHQLRGRAGRQGDVGSSRFFVSREDPLYVTYAPGDPEAEPDQLQRMAEGHNLDMRLLLRKYESVVEGQRLAMRHRREDLLWGRAARASERARVAALEAIDDLWSDYLAAVAELRAGAPWLSVGGRDPLGGYLREVHAMFGEMSASIDAEVEARLSRNEDHGPVTRRRGATWTYLTTDEPMGPMMQRFIRGLVCVARGRRPGR